MLVIYSDDLVEGMDGVYCSPRFYDGVDSRYDKVYTTDKVIFDDYTAVCIEVVGYETTPAKKTKKVDL